jgi:hypothetical protein
MNQGQSTFRASTIGRTLSIALCFVSLTEISTASTLYTSGTPLFVGTNITQTRAADDFILGSSGVVTDVRFYGSAFSPNTFPGNFSGALTYSFYNDASGALGSVISSGTVNSLSGVLWGVCGSNNCYTADFALNSSIALAAGTYWLELHEGTALNTSDASAITWAGLNSGFGGQPAGNSLFSASLATAPNSASVSDRAFVLFDNSTTSVPEPSSMTLLLIGVGATAFYRLRWADRYPQKR